MKNDVGPQPGISGMGIKEQHRERLLDLLPLRYSLTECSIKTRLFL